MTSKIYKRITETHQTGRKSLALLIDPDDIKIDYLEELRIWINKCHVDFFFVGGSLLTENQLGLCISFLKNNFNIPVVIFPGDVFQLSDEADAVLFLSLISGRNPELLIGKHVAAAPYLRRSGMEVIPTGYIVVDGGHPTSVTYMSQTMPVPRNKPEIASCTAIAGELLGLRMIYLDAGSGAHQPVSSAMIHQVKNEIEIPLIVGGGIRTGMQATEACAAGADLIVVGTAIEKNPAQLSEISSAIQSFNAVNELS